MEISVQSRSVASLTRSQQRGDETFAAHSQDGDRSVSAKKNAKGEIDWEAAGRRPQNDDDELVVCSTLIGKLNSEGEEWDQPLKKLKLSD